MNILKSYSTPDSSYARACSCNYHVTPLVIDCDQMMIYCAECGHEESIPEYALSFSKKDQYPYYYEPLREYVGATFVNRINRIIRETFNNAWYNYKTAKRPSLQECEDNDWDHDDVYSSGV